MFLPVVWIKMARPCLCLIAAPLGLPAFPEYLMPQHHAKYLVQDNAARGSAHRIVAEFAAFA